MDQFIDENYDMIYSKVCEVFPDIVHSDFYLEDIDTEEFVENYMREEYEIWKEKQQLEKTQRGMVTNTQN